jgi:hypothetical protein
VAVVSAGVGTFVLVTDDGGKRDQSARRKTSRFAFEPLFDRRSMAVQATLRF